MARESVLVVEDDPDIRELIRYNLQREGFVVWEASSGEEGLELAGSRSPSLILLDLMLPGVQGLEVCRQLKERGSTRQIPLIMVTAKGTESDIVVGLEMGADDYVVKPFSQRTLLARVRAVLRRGTLRGAADVAQRIELGDLVVDVAAHQVEVAGEPVEMTKAEFNVVRTLAESPGRVFTRAQLVRRITGGEHHIVERNVDVHIRSIRKKLGEAAELVQTVRGVGYKMDEISRR